MPTAATPLSAKAAGQSAAAGERAAAKVQTVHPRAPITAQRPVPLDLPAWITEPSVPRAVDCPGVLQPHGGTDNPKAYGTPLQQHVVFFDRNEDGIITPFETYDGFRKIGFNLLFSILGVAIIHFGFSYFTQDSWIPDPLFRIRVKNVHKCKHGSDSEGYDTEGRFVPQKMEEIFSKYDNDSKGYLTLKELFAMTEANRNVMDIFGWLASKLEWGTLWLLCSRGGRLSREDIRSCYDGSLFYRRAREEDERRSARRQRRQN